MADLAMLLVIGNGHLSVPLLFGGRMGAFPHRALLVYQKSIEVTVLVYQITRRAPRACWGLADQAFRACSSIPLNIAEGAGEYSAGDKARFYRIARRSASEATTALEVLFRIGAVAGSDATRADQLLGEIAAMLTTMIKRLEVHPPTPRPKRPSPSPSRSPSPKA